MVFRLNFYDFLHNRNLYDVNHFHVKKASNVGIDIVFMSNFVFDFLFCFDLNISFTFQWCWIFVNK